MNVLFYTPVKDINSGWAETYIAINLGRSLKKLGVKKFDIIDKTDLVNAGYQKTWDLCKEYDVVISHKEKDFIPPKDHGKTKFIYWNHNTWKIPSGYDGYMTARGKHWVKKISDFFDKPCIKVDLAVDHEMFKPIPKSDKVFDITYAGHKLDKMYNKYLRPASNHTLHIFGVPQVYVNDPYYAMFYRGQMPYTELPRVYNMSKVCLNIHHPQNQEMDMLTTREFEVLACGGFLMSDYMVSVPKRYYFNMDERPHMLEDSFKRFIDSAKAREKYIRGGRDWVLANHTYDHRAKDILDFVGDLK